MIRSIIAVSRLIFRWMAGAWSFFCRWFLPPAFPPDPPEDEPGVDHELHIERRRRVGWIDAEDATDYQDQAPISRPLYPTATAGYLANASMESHDNDGATNVEDADASHPQPPQDEEIHQAEIIDQEPVRPSHRPQFLSEYNDDDINALIRPPEGAPIARGQEAAEEEAKS